LVVYQILYYAVRLGSQLRLCDKNHAAIIIIYDKNDISRAGIAGTHAEAAGIVLASPKQSLTPAQGRLE
jgi:hypothetical protein